MKQFFTHDILIPIYSKLGLSPISQSRHYKVLLSPQENNDKLTVAQESDNLLKPNNHLSGILSSSQETVKHARGKNESKETRRIQRRKLNRNKKTTSITNLKETQITKGQRD